MLTRAPQVQVLNQMTLAHTLQFCFFKVHCNIITPSTFSHIHSGFPTRILSFPMLATDPTHLIIFDLM